MKTLDDDPQRLIRVPLARSCYLLLTWAEYERGLWRGKSDRRRLANEKRAERDGEEQRCPVNT